MAEMATTTTQTPPKKNRVWVLLAVLVVVGITAGIWYLTQNNKSQPKSASAPLWTDYKNDKYGLKFTYPTSWGAPRITESNSTNIKTYTVSFADLRKPPITVSLGFQSLNSKNVSQPACSDPRGCPTVSVLSAATIKARLSIDKKGLVRYDDSSYAMLSGNASHGLSQSLVIYRIVDLKKIKASAVYANYTILGNTSCPNDKFSSTGSSGCITEENYNNLNQVIKSAQSL